MDDLPHDAGPCPLSRSLSGLCTCTKFFYPGYLPAVAVPFCSVTARTAAPFALCFGGSHVYSNGQVVALTPGWRCLTPSSLTRMRCRDMLQVFSDGSFLAPMQTSCRLTLSRPPPQHRALGGYRQAGLSRVSLSPLSAPAHASAGPWVSLVSGLGSCVVGALPDRCVSRDATNVGKTPASRLLPRRAFC